MGRAGGDAPGGYPAAGQPPGGQPDVAPVRYADEGYPAAGHEPVIEPVTEKKEEKRDARAGAIGFDFEAGEFHELTEAHFQRWEVEFPAIDVRLSVLQAGAWLVAHDTARTRRMSMLRFLARWLSRAQDRAPRVDGGTKNAPHVPGRTVTDERTGWLGRATGRAAFPRPNDGGDIIDVDAVRRSDELAAAA